LTDTRALATATVRLIALSAAQIATLRIRVVHVAIGLAGQYLTLTLVEFALLASESATRVALTRQVCAQCRVDVEVVLVAEAVLAAAAIPTKVLAHGRLAMQSRERWLTLAVG
jgi:hypothetical protein